MHTTIILAGGASKRMGRDKATLPWGLSTVLEQLVKRFARVSSQIVVVAAPEQNIPDLPQEVSLVRDDEPHGGPLWGLYHGLCHVDPMIPAWVTGCDYPLLPAELPQWMLGWGEQVDIILLARDDVPQPLPGVYHPRVLTPLKSLLDSGARSMQALLQIIQPCIVAETLWHEKLFAKALMNVNTPDDYLQASLLGAEGSLIPGQPGKSG